MEGIAAARHGGKRQLVGRLLSLRGVSQTAVQHILELLDPDLAGRRSVANTLEQQLAQVQSNIQIPLTAGGHFNWTITLPQDLLPCIVKKCAGWEHILSIALQKFPPSPGRPWRFLLYLDEITPGNPLRPDNQRKIVAFYCSFLELGPFLRLEEAWLTIGVLRSTVVKTIAAGLSGVVRQLLRRLLLGTKSMITCGIPLPLQTPAILFARFHRLIADEAACKAIWGVKGAAGVCPCMDCKNVVAIAKDGQPSLCEFDPTGYLVDITCSDRSKFDPRGTGDLYRSHDILADMVARGCSKAECGRVEKASGVNFEPHGLLADHDLRSLAPPSSNVRDPMHIILANGVLNSEIYAFLAAWASCTPGFSYSTVQMFCAADWQRPHGHGNASKTAEVRCEQAFLAHNSIRP